MGFLLLKIAVLAIYVGGVWFFWTRFSKTLLGKGLMNQFLFSAFWPVWLITKASRRHLNRALKG